MEGHAVRPEGFVKFRPNLRGSDGPVLPRKAEQSMLHSQANDQRAVGMKREAIGEARHSREPNDRPGLLPEEKLPAAVRRMGEPRAPLGQIFPILRIGKYDL